MRATLRSAILAAAATLTACGGTQSFNKSTVTTASALATTPTFGGWSEVPGNGTSATTNASVVYRNRLYLFGIGINDHGHYVNVLDGGTWSGWSAVPGGGTTLLSDAAAVHGDKLYLFGIGIGDRAHYVNAYDGTTWSGWSAVPGGGTTGQPDDAVSYGGKLYLFGIGINDHAHYVNVFDGTRWSGWSAVPGGGTTLLADAAVTYAGNMYLFGIGINDHRYYVNVFDGAKWSGWSDVPGNGTTVHSATAAVHQGHLVLLGVALDDRHYENAYDGASWSGWREVAGNGTTYLADKATTYGGNLYLFAIGGIDHKHYMNVAAGAPLPPSDPSSPPFNHVWATATHNSYWVKRSSAVEAEATGTQERLVDQLLFDRTRAIEIDIHSDDPHPGNFTVYHTDNGTNSFCSNLDECLKQLQIFHYANPDHDPVSIVLEFKEIYGRTFNATHTAEDLDAILDRELGTSLYRPKDFLARCEQRLGSLAGLTMRDCARLAGWPSLAELRGKFISVPMGNWDGVISGEASDPLDWVDYATPAAGMATRSGFPMESTFATKKIADEFKIDPKRVNDAVNASLFAQVQITPEEMTNECDPIAATCTQDGYQYLVDAGVIVRAGANYPSTCQFVCSNDSYRIDYQADGVRDSFVYLQTDHPWHVLDNPGPARPYRYLPAWPLANLPPLVEKGNRVAFLQNSNGAQGSLDVTVPSNESARFETIVSVTRPQTQDYYPNARRPRGKGCLVAFGDRASDAVRVCRTTIDGERAKVTLEITNGANMIIEPYQSDDNDAGAYGELIRLDVAGACINAFSAGRVDGGAPAWTPLGGKRCMPSVLTHQALEAGDGDVLFVGTKRSWTAGGEESSANVDLGAGRGGDYTILDPADPAAVAFFSRRFDRITKETYQRGPGQVPTTCDEGQELDTGLCYTKCEPGFHGVGPVCWGTCPADHHDDGATCRRDVSIVAKPSYGRGVGTVPVTQPCAGGRENDAGLCYTKCEPGFHGAGPVCWQNCPVGYADDGATCRLPGDIYSKPSYGRGVGTIPWPSCNANQDYDAGLCYTKCAPGYHGVGPVCWGACKPGYADDGGTCRRDPIIFGKSSYGRGVGTVPPIGCNPGQQYDAGLCYSPCTNGYHGVGPVCWGTCPAGYADDGGTCRRDTDIIAKPSYGRGVGVVPHCGYGQEPNAGLCYDECAPGFVVSATWGVTACTATCPPTYGDVNDVCIPQ